MCVFISENSRLIAGKTLRMTGQVKLCADMELKEHTIKKEVPSSNLMYAQKLH